MGYVQKQRNNIQSYLQQIVPQRKQINKLNIMQQTDKSQSRIGSKKIYGSPTVSNLGVKQKSNPEINLGLKQGLVRITDHTDEKYSEISSNQNRRAGQQHGRVSQQQMEYPANQSRFTKNTRLQSDNGYRFLTQKQQNVIQLRERLKNIHHFYRIRIQQQRSKNIERNQIFIAVIQQLQKNHNEKVLALQKSLQQMQSDKQQMGAVDDRVISIKSTIEDILKQSQELKDSNQKLQKQIAKKQQVIKQKQENYMGLKQEMETLRNKLQQFQRLKIKENKRNKDLLQMIQHAF